MPAGEGESITGGLAMNRRQAVLALGGAALAAGAEAADHPPGGVRVPTATGHRDITGKEAETYHAVNAWLEQRLKEAASIRVGSTYADVAKHFRRDGGLSQPTKHRFVSVLCPFVKIDVELEEAGGGKGRHPLAPTAKVVSVTKPYFEREFGD
jgi:hypothetical protein